MGKLWSSDKRPKRNSIKLEINRLQRIHDALLQAVLEGHKKHQLEDLQELRYSIDELERLIQEGDDK